MSSARAQHPAAGDDEEESRPDVRLAAPAAAAWGTSALVLGVPAPAVTRLYPALAAVAFALAGAGTWWAWRRRPHPLARACAAVLLSTAAAVATAALASAEIHTGPVAAAAHARPGPPARDASAPRHGRPPPPPPSPSGTVAPEAHAVVVRVLRDAEEREGSATVLRARVEQLDGRAVRAPAQIVVRGAAARRWAGLLPSTRVAVDAARFAPPPPYGPEDVAAVLRVRDAPRLLTPPNPLQRAAGALRAGLRRAVRPLDPDVRALLPGLVDGDTAAVPPDLEEAFTATDLAHITAVSGANLAMVTVLLVGAAARARLPERGGLAARLGLSLRTTAAAGALLTLAFTVLCRPDPSVLRAAATGLLMLLGLATGRRAAALPALAGATLLLVLTDPWLSRSYGFALSALATAGLLTLGPRWAHALRRRGWPPFLAEAIAAAAAAQAWCGPLLVLRTARVSLVAVPCNLLAELAVAPATVLGFATLALHPLWPWAAGWAARAAAVPTGALIALARLAARLPGAELTWPGGWGGAALLLAATCALAVALGPLTRRRAPRALLGLALVLALLRPHPLTRAVTGWPPPNWRLVSCDVGQGDALVLTDGSTPAGALVVDAGPDPEAVDACLRALGVDRIALLLITHDHADHLEGVPGVLRHRQVAAIETTTADDPPGEYARLRRWAADARVPLLRARPGERRALGGLRWQVLWPDAAFATAPEDGPNNASVSLLATVSGLRIALLGDLEPAAQARLLAALPDHPELRGVDVLKVPHHGSAHQDAELLRALHPRLALISVGAHNRYGHPAAPTLTLLHTLGTTVLRTDREGDLAVLTTPALAYATRGKPAR